MKLEDAGHDRPAFSAADCLVPVPAATAEPIASPEADEEVARRSESEAKQGAEVPVTPKDPGAPSLEEEQENPSIGEPDKCHRRLDLAKFPDPPESPGGAPPGTLANLDHLLKSHGISVHWDVIRKKIHIVQDGASEVSVNEVYSLAALNRFPSGNLLPFINELGRKSPLNPIRDWIFSKPWDGTDRLRDMYATVKTVPDYPRYLKEALLYRWLLSATAAALKERGFFSRGVLTFQGPQGVGKTRWINRLMPAGPLRDSCIKLDLCIDGSKDSLMIAIRHWIAELGELESSFRRDMSRLKGVITNDCDKFRPPYGRVVEEFPRRTVFAATVNDEKFLIDPTGNSRWWTVPVESLDYEHGVDMQQVFAQLAIDFQNGEQWWLTGPEEDALADWNARHRSESAIAEKARDYLNKNGGAGDVKLTATQMLELVGVQRPSNAQCRECGRVLREVLGPPKRIRGIDKWAVAVHRGAAIEPDYNDPDLY